MSHPSFLSCNFRSERVKAFLFGVVALLAAVPASAQVGHDPASSPYLDLEHKQEITWLFGYMVARHDPAGVAPRSAAMTGVRYELNLVGPLGLSADVTRSFSSRLVLDPTKPLATRLVGTQSSPVYAADVALALDLTGRKSWHHLVPQLRADVTDRVFKLNYPDSYYRLASDNTSVLPVTTPSSFYTHQAALTLGVSYLFGR